jgi:hypothetical protein
MGCCPPPAKTWPTAGCWRLVLQCCCVTEEELHWQGGAAALAHDENESSSLAMDHETKHLWKGVHAWPL